jgi:hypothetical protein
MSWVAVGVAGASLVGGYMSSKSQKDAANNATDAQVQSAQLGVDESRYQFDQMKQLQQPYVNAGSGALAGQQNLLGLNGAASQADAVWGIQNSPMYANMAKEGENAMLQNASATGGLRGGNTQNALAQFRPQLLNQLIDQQYQRLGGLTSIGQNAAAGVGNAGMQTGQNIASLYGQQGAAQAGGALANGRANAQFANTATSAFTNFLGAKF